MGRKVAIVLAFCILGFDAYLAFATDLPQIVIVLVFFGSFLPYVVWLQIEPIER